MDALKAMKEEIARKKRELASQNLIGPERKYFKREDLMKKEEEEYREKVLGLSDQVNVSCSPSGQPGNQDSGAKDGQEKEPERILNRKEVIRRLRERGEPIKLFGESEVSIYSTCDLVNRLI